VELTKDLLLERRRSLEADSIAISGALQQVDWCLDKLEEEVVSEEAASDSP
jgi:hypothetical protein